MTRFTKQEILNAAAQLRINLDVVPFKTLKDGIKVELEHGLINPKTNITNDNIIKTLKIVLAHLGEGLDYYDELEKLEKKLKKEWRHRRINLYTFA